jgi:ATP-dependent DNA ligase
MLARLQREVPEGRYLFEPKWDGFRCLAFRDGSDVDLRSRHDRPLARYFPEVVEALRSVETPACVLDGEIVLEGPAGFDFAALMGRLHPAESRVARLAVELPAAYVAFDLLAVEGEDHRDRPFAQRRASLEALLADAPPRVRLTPATSDRDLAVRWLDRFAGGGVDGIVAKPLAGPYEPGRRAMVKVKRIRTAECVIAGVRLLGSPLVDPERPADSAPNDGAVSSLLLGLYDDRRQLRHVGVVTQFPNAERRRLASELVPAAVPLASHPWRDGFAIERSPLGRLLGSASRWTPEMGLDWLPLAPDRVVEVAFDQVDRDRFRHPARFVRWRPDRDADSCRIDQIITTGDALAAALAETPHAA